jgi:hypothetical protein
VALDLWGQEIVVEVPEPKPKRKRVAHRDRRPVYCGENNDIPVWFRENMPQTLAECADVRQALRKKEQIGNYAADEYHAGTGRKLIRLRGPVSNVMIVSPAARKLLNRKLKNRESYLKVLLTQFGTEQPEFTNIAT